MKSVKNEMYRHIQYLHQLIQNDELTVTGLTLLPVHKQELNKLIDHYVELGGKRDVEKYRI